MRFVKYLACATAVARAIDVEDDDVDLSFMRRLTSNSSNPNTTATTTTSTTTTTSNMTATTTTTVNGTTTVTTTTTVNGTTTVTTTTTAASGNGDSNLTTTMPVTTTTVASGGSDGSGSNTQTEGPVVTLPAKPTAGNDTNGTATTTAAPPVTQTAKQITLTQEFELQKDLFVGIQGGDATAATDAAATTTTMAPATTTVAPARRRTSRRVHRKQHKRQLLANVPSQDVPADLQAEFSTKATPYNILVSGISMAVGKITCEGICSSGKCSGFVQYGAGTELFPDKSYCEPEFDVADTTMPRYPRGDADTGMGVCIENWGGQHNMYEVQQDGYPYPSLPETEVCTLNTNPTSTTTFVFETSTKVTIPAAMVQSAFEDSSSGNGTAAVSVQDQLESIASTAVSAVSAVSDSAVANDVSSAMLDAAVQIAEAVTNDPTSLDLGGVAVADFQASFQEATGFSVSDGAAAAGGDTSALMTAMTTKIGNITVRAPEVGVIGDVPGGGTSDASMVMMGSSILLIFVSLLL